MKRPKLATFMRGAAFIALVMMIGELAEELEKADIELHKLQRGDCGDFDNSGEWSP